MTDARRGTEFSVHDIPFSSYGSWFCISPVLGQRDRAQDLHLVSHRTGMHGVLRLVPVDPATGRRVETGVSASPGAVDLERADRPDRTRLRHAGRGAAAGHRSRRCASKRPSEP